jgi:hypothetical protein
MWRYLILVSILSCASNAPAQDSTASSRTKLANKDIVLMVRSGLNDEIVSEKVRTSNCAFDTSPAALADLKTAGVSDSVILEMVRCDSRAADLVEKSSPSPSEPSKIADPKPKVYTASFIKSDRQWKFGLRSEPYDKISDYLETNLVKALEQHGLRQSPAPDGDCCFLTIELLEVTSHPAMIKKPGVDVTANLAITDSSKRILYSKGYRGESRTVMDTWGHLINHAVEQMVKTMSNDDNLTRVLATGKI